MLVSSLLVQVLSHFLLGGVVVHPKDYLMVSMLAARKPVGRMFRNPWSSSCNTNKGTETRSVYIFFNSSIIDIVNIFNKSLIQYFC